ncbi:MAG: hypothetical protein WBF01_20535 [Candidatus Acidiferrum sp.]
MINPGTLTKARKKQDGYALLMVVFLVTLVLVASMSIGLRVLTEGRREKEQEMIWRGQQYTRGIKLYYRKFGRFPTSLDNLTQPSVGNIRFMRQAYKDPMNKEDGSWRLIYVGPAGNLIGSINPAVSNPQMPGGMGQPAVAGTLPGTAPGAFGSQPGSFGSSSSPAPGTSPGAFGSAPAAGTTGTGTGAQGTDTAGAPGASGTGSTGTAADSQGVSGDTPSIVGGNIIGVGSKVNHSSVIVFEKAKNYHLFEFVWDPSKDMAIVSTPAAPIGTPAGTPGQNPMGAQPGTGSPTSNPPTTPPTPNPQQP